MLSITLASILQSKIQSFKLFEEIGDRVGALDTCSSRQLRVTLVYLNDRLAVGVYESRTGIPLYRVDICI